MIAGASWTWWLGFHAVVAAVLVADSLLPGHRSDAKHPVSYTHLDVYKRQGLDGATHESGFAGKSQRFESCTTSTGSVSVRHHMNRDVSLLFPLNPHTDANPVSYTHLDVYKRQN